MHRTVIAILLLAFNLTARASGTVDVLVSESHAVEDGAWSYAVKRSADPWSCGKSDQQRCVEQDVVIDNSSGRTLECSLYVDYKLPDGRVLASFNSPALVLPHVKEAVHRRITYAEPQAEVRHLSCIARPPYQRLPKTAGCMYEMRGDPLDIFYPESALLHSLEGPVMVAFSLPAKSGAARNIRVVESSLVPELDSAAVKFIQSQHFITGCPGTNFDLRVRFRLRELRVAGVN